MVAVSLSGENFRGWMRYATREMVDEHQSFVMWGWCILSLSRGMLRRWHGLEWEMVGWFVTAWTALTFDRISQPGGLQERLLRKEVLWQTLKDYRLVHDM
jgi:hypothetical protein